MLTFLALAGRLVSPLLAFVPGLSPRLLMVLAGLFAALVVIGGPAGAVWLQMRGERATAVAVERQACELSKAEDARVSAETLAHLLDRIAKSEEEETGTPADLCKRDPFCKSEGKK